MPRSSSLTFIVPDITASLEEAIATAQGRWPVLARLASRGTVRGVSSSRDAELRTWQGSLLEAVGLTEAARRYPSAAVCRAGATHRVSDECWAHVQAVHLAAGLNDLTGMLLMGPAALTNDERSVLTAMLNDHLRGEGYELLESAQEGEWLLRCPRPLQAHTVPPECAFSGELKYAMPQGDHAGELRRLMTEMQMLLHEHPVNIARARRRLPEANAGWVWGVGTIASERLDAGAALPIAYGAEPYLKGLYFLHGSRIRPQQFDAETVWAAARSEGAVLAVVPTLDLDTLESQWLAPFSRALQRGALAALALHLDRWTITVQRREWLRFWRRPLSPARWRA